MRVREFLQLWRGNFEILDEMDNVLCMHVMEPIYNELKYEIVQAAWFAYDKESNDHIMVIKVNV